MESEVPCHRKLWPEQYGVETIMFGNVACPYCRARDVAVFNVLFMFRVTRRPGLARTVLYLQLRPGLEKFRDFYKW